LKFLLTGLVLASLSIGWAATRTSPTAPPERSVTDRPIQIPEDGYVSSDTCRSCHPDQYASWHRSYHRTMTQVARPGTVRADFDGTTIADVHGRPMQLERRGNRYWAEFDDPDWSGEGTAAPRISREVVMITGSHHQQVYWYATGRKRLLGQLPGAYLIAEQRWIPRRMAVLHPPSDPVFSETGHWNSTCVACHATHGKPEFDTPFGSQPIETQTVDTRAVELGIACEACHGPSERHAALNRNPLRRYTQHLVGRPEPTTTEPRRLDPKRSSQVCGQCHGIWEFYDAAGERAANSKGLPYRPGDDLISTRFVAQPRVNAESPTMKALLADDEGFVRDSFWSDGMVRVSGREYNGLIESPCFTKAADPARTLSCFSCHTLHKTTADPRPLAAWADDQLGPGMDTDTACTNCHAPIRTNITAHTKHRADSSGSSCYNCHMPYTTYGLLKTIRSHTISSPSVRETTVTGRPNACNLCHLDKTLRWTSEHLERWYGAEPAALGADESTIAMSILLSLKGDAGQRAILAQAMGWPAAQQASGTDWIAPYLSQLLDDPYDAVRFIAGRSLATLPGFASFGFDFVQPPKVRYERQLEAMRVWDRTRGGLTTEGRGRRTTAGAPELLLDQEGRLQVPEVLRILRSRDNRRVLLRE
jgi:hypothetical protein